MGRQIKYGHLLHGGDYNPEQWLDRPDILKKDIEYFKEAKINTVGISRRFSNCKGCCLGEFIVASDYKCVKSVFRIQMSFFAVGGDFLL